jgi:hydroxyacylglutathione hydrolase
VCLRRTDAFVDVVPVPQLADNYAYLVIDPATAEAAVVDCADAGPVLAVVSERGVHLTAVLATHHHFDHVGGNQDLLVALPGLRVHGSAEEAPRIPGITHPVRDGGSVEVGRLVGRGILIPAHTSGHIAYHFPAERAVFTGDTLFAGGCGRLFEGDAAQMMGSLGRLTALPDDTRVYCGHEYTEKNLRFAAILEPGNCRLTEKLAEVEALRRDGKPTVPSTIGDEKATNPFLRIDSPELAASVRKRVPGLAAGDRVALFAAVRSLKDRF